MARLASLIASHKKFRATTGNPGVVLQGAAQVDTAGAATLATLIADHNALLAKLRVAGIIAS